MIFSENSVRTFRDDALTAADVHARHHHLLALAGALVDLGAGMELQILAEADAYRVEALGIAADRDRLMRQPRIGGDKGVLDLARRHGLAFRQVEIVGRNLHESARLAHGLEIGPRRQPRAGAVTVPLAE